MVSGPTEAPAEAGAAEAGAAEAGPVELEEGAVLEAVVLGEEEGVETVVLRALMTNFWSRSAARFSKMSALIMFCQFGSVSFVNFTLSVVNTGCSLIEATSDGPSDESKLSETSSLMDVFLFVETTLSASEALADEALDMVSLEGGAAIDVLLTMVSVFSSFVEVINFLIILIMLFIRISVFSAATLADAATDSTLCKPFSPPDSCASLEISSIRKTSGFSVEVLVLSSFKVFVSFSRANLFVFPIVFLHQTSRGLSVKVELCELSKTP